jgi:hypothetical protein
VSDENFLARWSQRKRQVAEEARKAPEPEPQLAPVEEPLDLSLLPDIEALTAESDIALFMQKGVPDTLRNAALRKMWALDPAIRDYVGDALDYAWDWNAPGGVPGGGELGEGFDTAKMVAQIFGDAPADKNVTEHVAAQQSQHSAAGPLAGATPAAALDDSPVQENAAEPGLSAQAPVIARGVAPENAPHKKRRNGGAAPPGLAKGLMS